jgi:hypothetical protein
LIIPLPAGTVASSPKAFQTAWDAAAPAANVPTITSWDQMPLDGDVANIANLGGNVRVALASKTADGPVAAAILAWLPPPSSADQATQDALYRDAFSVLMKTVNPSVTASQQTAVATHLGLSPSKAPFAAGATADATLPPQHYRRAALEPQGQSGVYTMIAVTEAT